MLNVKKTLTKILDALKADYIVEQGTSGIWTYRKWNSGIAECWGKEAKVTPVTTAWGNGYVSSQLSTSFPSGLFVNAPITNMYVSGGYSGIISNSNSPPTASSVAYAIFRPAQCASQTFYAHVHAVGTWK